LTCESLWHPGWPFIDSITGSPPQRLAEDYTAKTGEQWVASLAQYAGFEWAVDVFKRVRDVDDREEVIGRVRTTTMKTCLGPIDFTTPVDAGGAASARRPAENVYKAPVAGVQWVRQGSATFQPTTVSNAVV